MQHMQHDPKLISGVIPSTICSIFVFAVCDVLLSFSFLSVKVVEIMQSAYCLDVFCWTMSYTSPHPFNRFCWSTASLEVHSCMFFKNSLLDMFFLT